MLRTIFLTTAALTVSVACLIGPAVPASVRQLVGEREKAIAAGTLHPFQDPVMDQSGKVRIPKGKTMSDGELLGMNWYVEGVVGKLPK